MTTAAIVADQDLAEVCASRASYEAALACSRWSAAWGAEQALARRGALAWRWVVIPGHCSVCRRRRTFWTRRSCLRRGFAIDSGGFRSGMKCLGCRLLGRQRKIVDVLHQHGLGGKDIYVTEQRSRFFRSVRSVFGAGVVGSEYLGPSVPRGSTVGGLRHEDLFALSFRDASFDCVVCCDVLEHVPDPRAALAEMRRVLRPKGTALISVPFHGTCDATVQRATVGTGGIEHHLPPEYHDNPLDGTGSLVFSEFGWDLLRTGIEVGYAAASVHLYWSQRLGYLGFPPQYMVMTK